MATDGTHLNPPLLAIEDELTEVRRLLTVMANNAGSDQAHIALETIVYKYHANLLRMNELLATHDIVRVPIRPPDADQQQQIQHLLRENDELINKLQKFETDMDLVSSLLTGNNIYIESAVIFILTIFGARKSLFNQFANYLIILKRI